MWRYWSHTEIYKVRIVFSKLLITTRVPNIFNIQIDIKSFILNLRLNHTEKWVANKIGMSRRDIYVITKLWTQKVN